MKKLVVLLFALAFLTGCGTDTTENVKPGTYKQISKEEVHNEMNQPENKEIYIIDVRTQDEYIGGHIPTALNIPLNSITSISNIIPDKSVKIVVYCQSGNRSKQAASLLLELGYQEVYDLGGIVNWDYEITQ